MPSDNNESSVTDHDIVFFFYTKSSFMYVKIKLTSFFFLPSLLIDYRIGRVGSQCSSFKREVEGVAAPEASNENEVSYIARILSCNKRGHDEYLQAPSPDHNVRYFIIYISFEKVHSIYLLNLDEIGVYFVFCLSENRFLFS